MWPNPQETADLVTFTEEILEGKLHFLRSVTFTEEIVKGKLYFLHSVLQILLLNCLCSLSLWVVSTIFLHVTIFYSLNDTDIATYADNITPYASPSKTILTFVDQMTRSAKNTVISPNFLVWKFCRKTYLKISQNSH